MARRKGVDSKIQVTRGFVTEFTPVAFPQEAAIDIDNCIIDADGSVRRRPGIDLEPQFQLSAIASGVVNESEIDTIGLSNHLWEFVGNSGTLNIVVFQVGVTLQMFAQFGAISANLLGEIDLTPFAVDVAKLQTSKVEVASGLGDLLVVGKFMNPVRIEFDGVTTFTATQIDIKIRDFKGIDDELLVDERPATLSRNHYYNLRNQGWTDTNIKKFGQVASSVDLCNEARSGTEPLFSGEPSGFGTNSQIFRDLINNGLNAAGGNLWPSNSDIMTVGIVTNPDGALEFDGSFIRGDFLGNTPAPKGHFILEAFAQDLDAALGCPGTGSRTYATRPSAVAFHQGRAFYSTPTATQRISGIFYSQQLITKDRIGKCFQEADPTADEINDLIDTDGGFLPMPGVGEILTLREFGSGIVVMATNGVWFITGADGSGMSATNIKLSKVSSAGVLSASSVVEAEGVIMYFGIDGIMQLSTTDLGDVSPTSITQKTIQTFYINISAASRRDAVGIYIPEQRKIFWGYRDAAAATTPDAVGFNRMLVLDFEIKGFYKYSIQEVPAQELPRIVGMTLIKPLTLGVNESALTDIAGALVLDEGAEVVTATLVLDSGQITQLKMAVLSLDAAANGYKTSFASFHSRTFTDWQVAAGDNEGLPMVSFIEFAEFNMQATHTRGRPTHVHSFFSKESKNLREGDYYELPLLGSGCDTPTADIMLVVDNTGSQKQDEYFTVTLPAINNMIQQWIDSGFDGTLGSVVITAAPFLLNSLTTNFATVQSFISALPTPSGLTNIATAINLAATELTLNGREGVTPIMVIVTDGAANSPNGITAYHEAEAAALAARNAGIRIVVFGVLGQDLSDQEGGGGG